MLVPVGNRLGCLRLRTSAHFVTTSWSDLLDGPSTHMMCINLLETLDTLDANKLLVDLDEVILVKFGKGTAHRFKLEAEFSWLDDQCYRITT